MKRESSSRKPQPRNGNTRHRNSYDESREVIKNKSQLDISYSGSKYKRRQVPESLPTKHHLDINSEPLQEGYHKSQVALQNDPDLVPTIAPMTSVKDGHEVDQRQYWQNRNLGNSHKSDHHSGRPCEQRLKRHMDSHTDGHDTYTYDNKEKIEPTPKHYKVNDNPENINIVSTIPEPREPKASIPANNAVIDCEVLIFDGQQRNYADEVVTSLIQKGINSQWVLVPTGINAAQAVDSSSRRGLPFVITIFDQNEARRSVTLNILFGTPQEHRNMPLENALEMAKKTHLQYTSFFQDCFTQSSTPTNLRSLPPAQNPDRNLKRLFMSAIEGGNISLNDIDNIRRYLNKLEDKLLTKRASSRGSIVTATSPCNEPMKHPLQDYQIYENVNSSRDWYTSRKGSTVQWGPTGDCTPEIDNYPNRVYNADNIHRDPIHSHSNINYGKDFKIPLRNLDSPATSNVDLINAKWNTQRSNEHPVDNPPSPYPYGRNRIISPDIAYNYHLMSTNTPQENPQSYGMDNGLSHGRVSADEHYTINDRLITRPNATPSVVRSHDNRSDLMHSSDSTIDGNYDSRSFSWIPQP
ncbi:Nuclear receptor coactivator 5 [Trichoplax sp. H2]|nr:Nuclear receptor coactivator 5 [Trichoplax sp. H2]|eukprot:RDD46972.1 Nuclear receptor coactivator 5 [Trichoplax sp. H2]